MQQLGMMVGGWRRLIAGYELTECGDGRGCV